MSTSHFAPPRGHHSTRVSWHTLMHRHRGGIRASLVEALSARRLRAGHDELDDLTQEVFLRLIRASRDGDFDPRQRGSGQVVRYLKRVIRSLLVDRARAAAAQKRIPQPALGWSEQEIDAARSGDVVWDTPEDRLLSRERRRLFVAYCRRQAARLPLDDRTAATRALQLTVLAGWSSREASRALDHRLTPGQIDSLVHRLRRALEADGYAMPRRGRARAA